MTALSTGLAYQLQETRPGHGIYAGRRHWLVIDGDELVTRIGLRPASTDPATAEVPSGYAHAYSLLAELEGRNSWDEEVAAAQAEAMELVDEDAAAALSAALESVAEDPAPAPGNVTVAVAETTPAPRSRVSSFDA